MIAKQTKVITSTRKAVITATRDKHETESLSSRVQYNAAKHLKHCFNNQVVSLKCLTFMVV